MKNTARFYLLLFTHLFFALQAAAQDSSNACRVSVAGIDGMYKGDCRNGLASGYGEASGAYRYKGAFKRGKPDGYGVYHYNDSSWYAGYFLDGIKEGKGELHYAHAGQSDSIIHGYWSGNILRGNKYITYDFDGGSKFDRSEIVATPEIGRTIAIEIHTTSGSPAGFATDLHSSGNVLTLADLNAADGTVIRQLSNVITPTKTIVTYDIDAFPVILYAKLSNGDSFKLQLYKAARWTIRLFVNN